MKPNCYNIILIFFDYAKKAFVGNLIVLASLLYELTTVCDRLDTKYVMYVFHYVICFMISLNINKKKQHIALFLDLNGQNRIILLSFCLILSLFIFSCFFS